MSTRATIQFTDEDETYFVYRHSDGSPGNVLRDIEAVLQGARGRWSGSEVGMLVSYFLGMCHDAERRLPDYILTTCWHGDESYRYFVEWDTQEKAWKARVGN